MNVEINPYEFYKPLGCTAVAEEGEPVFDESQWMVTAALVSIFAVSIFILIRRLTAADS